MAIDNTLLGKYDKEASNVKEAIYRVKNAEDDGYVRVHFETNSKMVHDSTDSAAPNKIARRNSEGSISFNKTNSNSLEVSGVSSLNGDARVGGFLTVADGKTTTLGGALTVKGESNFNSKSNLNSEAEVKGMLSVVPKTGGANGDFKVSGNSSLSGTLTVGSTTNINSTLTVANNTELKGELKVGKATAIQGAVTINNDSTLGKTDNTSTTTINGLASINKVAVKDSTLVANLNADRVDDCHVSDAQISTLNLWTAKKVDDTKADKTVKVSVGTGLVGGGTLASNFSITHSQTTREDSTPNLGTSGSGCLVTKSIVSNALGHITGVETINLDTRYPIKTISINGTNGLIGGGTLQENRTISHAEVSRTSTEPELSTDGTTCKVLKSLTTNLHGHATASETVDLDKRYYTKDLTNQQIENKISNVVGNDVILKNPSSGTVNGSNLKMEGFTMQFNKTANAIEFVFI